MICSSLAKKVLVHVGNKGVGVCGNFNLAEKNAAAPELKDIKPKATKPKVTKAEKAAPKKAKATPNKVAAVKKPKATKAKRCLPELRKVLRPGSTKNRVRPVQVLFPATHDGTGSI